MSEAVSVKGMESLRELYKSGYGPSSSHTMGPVFAAKRFLRDIAGNKSVFGFFLNKSEVIFRISFHSEILKFLPQKAIQNGGGK